MGGGWTVYIHAALCSFVCISPSRLKMPAEKLTCRDTSPHGKLSTSGSSRLSPPPPSSDFRTAKSPSPPRPLPPRVGRACDACRKHKVKCQLEAVGACENCLRAGRPCTFQALGVKRERPPTKRDVDKLTLRIQKLEHILRVIAPTFDFSSLPRTSNQAHNFVRRISANDGSSLIPSPSGQNLVDYSPTDLMSTLARIANLRISSKSDWELNSSSGSSVVGSASEVSSPAHRWLRGLSDEIPSSPVEDYMGKYTGSHGLKTFPLPPPALADSLIDLFFQNVNPFENLIHQGEFMRLYRGGLAECHVPFRGLCFALFAAGSRFSPDPRVFPISPGETPNRKAAGALFLYSSISLMAPDCVPCTLHDLQSMAVLCYITCCSCSPLTVWSSVASHLRRAQAAGAHREDATQWQTSIMTDQLRKRAVWYLAKTELRVSSALGRTTALKREELDLELPLCVDDDALAKISRIEAHRSRQAAYDAVLATLESSPGSLSQKAFAMTCALKKCFGLALQKCFSVRLCPDLRVWHWDRTAVLALSADVDAYFEQNMPCESFDLETMSASDMVVGAQMRCASLSCRILVHRLLISSDSSEITVCLKASNALIDTLDHIHSRGLLELTASWSPYLVTPPALTMLFVARGKHDCMLPMDRANAWAGVHRCINILNALAPIHFVAEQLSISVNQLVQVCIEEELFMSNAGQRGSDKKREASDVIDDNDSNERRELLESTKQTLGKSVHFDQSSESSTTSGASQSNCPLKDTSGVRLRSEDFFGLPHLQLDALLFESPGRTLMPGLSCAGSPEWLDFAAPTEAFMAAGTYGASVDCVRNKQGSSTAA